jgi:hypothetical protein
VSEFDLDRDLSDMLGRKSDDVSQSVETNPAVIGRARTRRRNKITALGASGFAAMALLVGVAVATGDDERSVKIEPVDTTTGSTVQLERVLGHGALVAATNQNRLVELAIDGSVVRELADLSELGLVVEIDPHPNGNEVYVRTAAEFSCGDVVRLDLVTGNRESIGQANGVAISGDGQVLALSAALEGGEFVCAEGGARMIVARHLGSGRQIDLALAPDTSPDFARGLALNADGTRLAFEQCWEGCFVRHAEVPLACFDGTAVCDRDVPKWDALERIAGSGGGEYEPAYHGPELLAVECTCAVEADDPEWRLAAFDATTGERDREIAPIEHWMSSVFVGNDLFVLTNDNTIVGYDAREPVQIAVAYAALGAVPGDAPTQVPSQTVVEPTTTASVEPFEPLAPGAIVAARPDGVIVELDTDGNELREIYNTRNDTARLAAVHPNGRELWFILAADTLCGSVYEVDLVAGTTSELGQASSVAVSGNGALVAFAASMNANERLECSEAVLARAVVVKNLATGWHQAYPSGSEPDGSFFARTVALSWDGSRLAIEQCFEGCETRITQVAIECLDGSRDCDQRTPPKWDEMTVLAHEGSGYGAGANFATFQGETIFAAVCDCEVEAPSQNYRLVTFDAQTGEQLSVIQDLPDNVTSLSVAGDAVLVGIGNTTLIRYTDEPFTFPAEYTSPIIVAVASE